MDKIKRSSLARFSSLLMKLLLLLILLLVTAIVVRTVDLSRPRAAMKKPCKLKDSDYIGVDNGKLKKFQKALQFETISWSEGNYNRDELYKYGNFLIEGYPVIHNNQSTFVEWERVNNYSLLYHVKGSNSQLLPYLLMSHMDVVPVSDPEVWDRPPFSGDIKDGFVYGRGAMDVKQTTLGIMESLSYVLEHEARPERSFFVAIGHDEEVRGNDGAKHLAAALRQKGVKEFEFIFDEGMTITEGIVSGVKRPVASVGVVEKGQIMLKLKVKGIPGHSSMPDKESVIGILSKAVHKLESYPAPSQLGNSVEKDSFEALAPEMNVFQRILLANIWIFKPIISWFMEMKPVTNALIRTVTSVTMFNAGIKINVLPSYAEAIVNHRIHPAQTVQEVIDYDKYVIGDDRVEIEIMSAMEAHPVAGYGSYDFGYQVLKSSIGQIWPAAVTIPAICIGNTDTVHFLNFTKNVYRFSPTYMYPGDPPRFHGNNERLSVNNYEQVINFYYHLIKNSNQHSVSPFHKPHEEF